MVIGPTSYLSNLGIVNATPSTQGTLRVIKQIDMQAEGGVAPSPSQFTIEVVFSRDGNEADPGSSSGIDYERPAGTTYHVGEISAPGIDSFPRFVGDCGRDEFGNVEEDTIEAGETKTCTVTNTVNAVEEGPVTEEGVESQTAGPQDVEEFDFQSGLAVRPGRGTAPFDRCVAPILQNSTTVGDDSTKEVIHAPSSASYTVDGTTHIRDLFESLQDNNALTIKLFQDRLEDDGVTLGVASPIFTGQLFVGEDDPELFPSDAFRYDIDDISTECEFITLTNPISQNPQVMFHPLGNTSEIKTRSLDFDGDPTTNHIPNKLLAYCAKNLKISNDCVKSLNALGFSSVTLNPPFRSCQSTLENSQGGKRIPENGQAWAQYIIKGNVGTIPTQSFIDLVSGDSTGQFIIKVIADLVLLNSDEIKIADSNNPFLTIYFVVNPGEPTATRVPFTIQQVSTSCNAADFIEDPQVN